MARLKGCISVPLPQPGCGPYHLPSGMPKSRDFCLLLTSYLRRIKRKENSSYSACGHQLQELTHLLLDYPASKPLRMPPSLALLLPTLISGLDLGAWPDCWVFAEFLQVPSLGRGSTTTTKWQDNFPKGSTLLSSPII